MSREGAQGVLWKTNAGGWNRGSMVEYGGVWRVYWGRVRFL